jgi:membrane protease YdiL (CAAX protease family)
MTSAPVLGPTRALVVFVVFFVVQFVAGLVIGVLAGLAYALGHAGQVVAVTDVQGAVVVTAALVGEIVGGLFAFRMARRALPGPLGSGALLPIGWSRASSRDLLLASAAGVALACLYLLVLVPAFPPSPSQAWGPLATAASSGGWPRHTWAVLALAVAPPVEEFVFRGVLFAGFRRSWGLGVAGVLVTVLFVAGHVSEVTGYGPAAVGVLLLGGATLVARIATRSLGPAIALHAAYNLGLVVVTYASGA